MKNFKISGRTLWIFGLGLNAAILSKITTYVNSLLLTIGFALIIAGVLLESRSK